jgi:hypothetical protein
VEKPEYRKNVEDMIALTRYAVNGEKPDAQMLASLDLPRLLAVCQSHMLTSCVAYALEAGGIRDDAFVQAKGKAIRKNILLDTERAAILQRLEQEKIWYMPLKGALLKDWYPKLGMRQMSDNDILVDPAGRDIVREIMHARGFTLKNEQDCVDEFLKEPVYNFEMHVGLFMGHQVGALADYFVDVKDKLQKDEGNGYGWHFRPEDFYIFLMAHEYKHYIRGGTGVRSLLDTYIFMKKFGASLDMGYLQKELTALGIEQYEKESRSLAMKVFSGEALSPEEQENLDYYISSGTYGTYSHLVGNRVALENDGSKSRYILHRLFPSKEEILRNYPFFREHPRMLPLFWVWRPFHGLLHHRKGLKTELEQLKKK